MPVSACHGVLLGRGTQRTTNIAMYLVPGTLLTTTTCRYTQTPAPKADTTEQHQSTDFWQVY